MDRFDLGSHGRQISTKSVDSQRWFNIGLNWCYSFNHEEAVKCFKKVLEFDPQCVMAHWGIAYASGPFYNFVWRDFGEQEAVSATKTAYDHIAIARSHYEQANEAEKQLLDALSKRFQKPFPVSAAEYDRWDDEYAAAMRRVYYQNIDDHDIAALFAEALITRTPRRLWNTKTGEPALNSDVLESLYVCERSIASANETGIPQHPAIVHLHIHILEMSNEPERAMRSADALADSCPDAGHMNHMPAHIYVLCGEYEKAKIASEKSIRADDKYAAYDNSTNFYITARCHDLHLMMFSCMLLGQYNPAIEAAEKMQRMLTKDILSIRGRPKLATTTEGYYSTKMHVLVRFGRWQKIIDEPFPNDPDLYLVSIAMHRYARGVAHASMRNIAKAEQERFHFHESLSRIPADRRFLSNPVLATLAVGEKMLDGELEYHKGNHEAAFTHLREAVRRDDNLGYTEPWSWMHPPRHALGALLMEQGQIDEAEETYRDDLGLGGRVQRCTQHPDNVWALHGLVECLERRGETREIASLRGRLAAALQKVDVPITSSCMCRGIAATPSRLLRLASPSATAEQKCRAGRQYATTGLDLSSAIRHEVTRSVLARPPSKRVWPNR